MKCVFECLIRLGSVATVIILQRGFEDYKNSVREATFMMHVERYCPRVPHTVAGILNKLAVYEWSVPSCVERTSL